MIQSATIDLTGSPAWYPLSIIGGEARLVRLSEADYAAASFLDERLLHHGPPLATVTTARLLSDASELRPRAHYLFHIGHVGSTLISRLLGAMASVFSVREPALLRVLARDPVPAPLPLAALLGLLARTWRPRQVSVVKVTSFVSEIGTRVLSETEASKAILIMSHPLAYLRSILGGPNSRVESRALAGERMRRLVRRSPGLARSAPNSEGEVIAMSWLSEMSSLEDVAQSHSGRVCWVDFDHFLQHPAAALARLAGALGIPCETSEAEALVAGSIMQRYSKAPEYAYDSALRREVMQAAEAEHFSEIRAGMSWLELAARDEPRVRHVLDAAEALQYSP